MWSSWLLAHLRFIRRALMPLEDQGYCIIIAQLPAGSSQPRVREVADRINAILKQSPGVKGWVTIGGFSALDSANLSNFVTVFVIYDDWTSARLD